MKLSGLNRREFLAVSFVAASAPSLLMAGKNRYKRVLIDTCNQFPLANVRVRLLNLETRQLHRFKTDPQGAWEIEPFIDSVKNPEGELFETTIGSQMIEGITYAGLKTRMILYPKGINKQANRMAGQYSLVPLDHPGIGLGIDDEELSAAWPALLEQVLFVREPAPFNRPEGLARGALYGFAFHNIALVMADDLSPAEQEFVSLTASDAVKELCAGTRRFADIQVVTPDSIPAFSKDFRSGTFYVNKNDTYPFPSTFLKHDDAQPQFINAAKITLDNLTLTNLYRHGNSEPKEQEMARHLISRALAHALGYRPTLALRNRTLMDSNFMPTSGIERSGITPVDTLLARVLYGSGWLKPGSRFSEDGRVLRNFVV